MNRTRILVVGHSHIAALKRGWGLLSPRCPDVEVAFMGLRQEKYLSAAGAMKASTPAEVRLDLITEDLSAALAATDAVVYCLNGNEHNNLGMFTTGRQTAEAVEATLRTGVRERCGAWLKALHNDRSVAAFLLYPPPPVEDEEFILKTDAVQELSKTPEVRSAAERHRFWEVQCQAIDAVAAKFGARVVPLPDTVLSETGFLARDCYHDLTHGNKFYGERVLAAAVKAVRGAGRQGKTAQPASQEGHPYSSLPDYMFWKRAVSQVAPGEVDPVVQPAFTIGINDKVATAGSCFAQHISKRLRAGGFQFLVTESAKAPVAGETAFHDFSARYGNVYTARQLLQLFDRAFGYFTPLERAWQMPNGRFCDPFRPTIEPDGYESQEAVLEASRQHLSAVRKMFLELDVFVFTLGLTECWSNRLDGAAYPLAPGVAGGTYDPEVHAFVNFGVADVVGDLHAFIGKLRTVNPGARVLLTVSPVPLAATYVAGRHVLVSTARSKAVLRVAADEVCSSHAGVYYFPSYEIIINGDGDRNYFAPDRRTVRDEGVDHVMRVFMSRMVDNSRGSPNSLGRGDVPPLDAEIEAMNDALCDEAMLDADDAT